MPYVDGFVIPIPKKNMDGYVKMARRAGKVWMNTVRWSIASASATT